MKDVVTAMPNGSTLMLSSTDISPTENGSNVIRDLGNTNGGVYMIMKGADVYRVSLLNINSTSSSISPFMRYGCYASGTDTVTWWQASTANVLWTNASPTSSFSLCKRQDL
jgi:hypothetical protein